MRLFKDLYFYRELLKTNIQKDVGGKYKKSFLGVLWSFINPLLQILVYWIVFDKILHTSTKENYVVYLCCGLIPWQFFAAVVNRGAATIIENGSILKKVYFPREIFPISLVASETVNFMIATIMILVFVIAGGITLTWNVLWYIPILLVQFILSIGIAFIVSSISVYVRDLIHILGILVQLMFYATPIVYALDQVPEKFAWVAKLNPMAYLIENYRNIFYEGRMPNFEYLGIALAMGLGLCFIGYFIFKQLEKRFAEEL